MGVFDFFNRRREVRPVDGTLMRAVQAYGEFYSLDDAAVAEFLKDGKVSTSGVTVSEEAAMRNPAVFRSVSLLAQTIGMLPVHLIDKETKEKARDHGLFETLHRRPNDFQSAYSFRVLMQTRALVNGNAYALIVRGRGSQKSFRFIPLDPERMTASLNPDWSPKYEYQPKKGAKQVYGARDILHVTSMTYDGLKGISLVRQAADAIGLAISAELAAARMFQNGAFVNGVLESEKPLGEAALRRLKAAWQDFYSGASKAGGTPVLEQGLKYKPIGPTSRDAQHMELREHQVEEIARIFGIPRPLLMVDETSWGSGIEALGQFFVRYGLGPWIEAWQQAIERSVLDDADRKAYEVKFNTGALTRGSLKDQADYFAKASGSGGHQGWLTVNQILDMLDMPAHPDGDKLPARPGAAEPATTPNPETTDG